MNSKVLEISAIGTRCAVKGRVFLAKPNSDGVYILNRKTTSPEKGNTTNHGANKVVAKSLEEAVELLKTDNYLINLVCSEGTRALREFKKVKITLG